jgi:hypothetical protein
MQGVSMREDRPTIRALHDHPAELITRGDLPLRDRGSFKGLVFQETGSSCIRQAEVVTTCGLLVV